MFENRSKKQRTIIYIIIAFIATCILGIWHYISWSHLPYYAILIAGIIEFFCIFYVLYLPLKIKG
ncbi:hypothetical protein B6U98_05815 [Thermoplasmatales archaeon ex4572_165]|nr:MAG: hypothetical protein B6U98_05815 [Thermoplasmatales archaeon ex4572_165]